LEIKAFSSQEPSPTSFGPREKWDHLFFVDARDYKNQRFIVYHIPLGSNNPIFTSIKINATETYSEQCLRKIRPRKPFEQIQSLLPNNLCRMIFSGHIDELK